MKTFTATHLNKHAQEVFAAAKEDGTVLIEHDRYGGGSFAIAWTSTEWVESMQRDRVKGFVDFLGNKDAC